MPSPRLKCKRASRPRPLSEAEAARNTVLHLQYGFGCERIWPTDQGYQAHHRDLTVAVLRRLWPEHRQKIMASWRDPGQRPFGWWLCESPKEIRDEYLSAWRTDYRWRMSDGVDEPDESIEEVQARLLCQAGLLGHFDWGTDDDGAHQGSSDVDPAAANVPVSSMRIMEYEVHKEQRRPSLSRMPGVRAAISISDTIAEAQ